MTGCSDLQDQAESILRDWARVVSVDAVAEMRSIVDQAFTRGQQLHGEDFTEGAGPDETCGCGEEITWYDGEWMHIANPALRGSDDHDAEPDSGYYIPDGSDEADAQDAVRCSCTLLFYSDKAMKRHLEKTRNHGLGAPAGNATSS